MITFSNLIIQNGTLSKNRGIASPSYFEASFKVDKDLNPDLKFYTFSFSFALWCSADYQQSNTPGALAYYDFSPINPSGIVPNQWYDCVWSSNASSYIGKCQIKFNPGVGECTVGVRLFFLSQYDIHGSYKDLTYTNRAKFLKDSINSTTEVDNTANFNDVYSNDRFLKCFVGVNSAVPFEENKFEIVVPNALRFYNMELYGNSPMLSQSAVSLERINVVPDLASNEDTLVRIRVKDISMPPSWTTGLKVYLMLVRVSSTDNSIIRDWNYSLRYIEANSFTGDLDANYGLGTGDVWIAPQTGVTPIGGGEYEVTATLEHSRLTAGGKYRIIHIWRVDNAGLPTEAYPIPGTNIHDFPFITAEFECNDYTPVVPIQGVAISENYICDYLNCYTGSLIATVGERLLSKIKLNFSAYNMDVNRKLDMIEGISSVRTMVWSDTNDFLQNTKHLYTDKLSTREGNTWSNAEDVDIFTVGNSLYLRYHFRLRYDSNERNLATYKSIADVKTAASSTQDWSNRFIYVVHLINIHNIDNNTGEEFRDLITIKQKIFVKGFDMDGSGGELEYTIEDGIPYICNDGDDYNVCVNKPPSSPEAKFITIFESEPYSSLSAKECESFSDVVMPQLTTGEIYDVAEDFVDDEACFNVHVASLPKDRLSRVIGIKKNNTGV